METYERILSESFALFIRYGIKSVTMDDITRHIGISKKTIYEHFIDKDDLLKQGLVYHKKIQDNRIQEVISTSSNVLETIYRFMFEVTSQMHKVNSAFHSDLKKHHYKLCEEVIPKHHKEKMVLLEKLIAQGIADGIFRNDFKVEMTTRILDYQFRMLSDDELFPAGEYARPELFRSIIEFFTRGIATPKGIAIIEGIIEREKSKYNNK